MTSIEFYVMLDKMLMLLISNQLLTGLLYKVPEL